MGPKKGRKKGSKSSNPKKKENFEMDGSAPDDPFYGILLPWELSQTQQLQTHLTQEIPLK